ncbi:MAG: glycosyltransferase [Paracoccaceae bacterium]
MPTTPKPGTPKPGTPTPGTPTPPPAPPRLSVIIPAHDEAGWIGACLGALLAQDSGAGAVEVIVAANACRDDTVARAEAFRARFAARGWDLVVLDLPEPGKLNALNRAEAAARGAGLVYLDADVRCEPPLLGELAAALAAPGPVYATGRLAVAPAQSRVTRAYARIWTRLPFVESGAVGAGLFAVNREGRARWGAFPAIISDDTFVRLQFTPAERVEVAARYHWPMVEGWANLVKVRRRQDAGVAELARLHPALGANEGKARLGPARLVRLALGDPVGFAVYLSVHLAVRLRPAGRDWTRGR